MMRPLPFAPILSGLLMLACCGTAPVRSIYVLGQPAAPVAGVASDAGKPVIELRPVVVPDYLDNTDLQTRDGGNQLKVSRTGRWGERLSIGVTGAVAEELTRRLPGVVLERSGVAGPAAGTLLIDIDAFDVREDGHCVLAAHWTVLGGDRRPEVSRRATIVTEVPNGAGGVTDAGVVSAMASAVRQLADDIARDLGRAARSGTGFPPDANGFRSPPARTAG